MHGMSRSGSEGFISAADLQAQKNLAQYYGEKRPNKVLTGRDTNVDLKNLTGTYFGKTNDFVSPLKTAYALPNNAMSGDLFAKSNEACVAAGGGSSAFKRLSYLADNVDQKQKMRCGWVFNNADPSQGGGAYGTRDGPIDTNFQGDWFWNLADAKQKYHKLICSQVKDCGDLGGPNSPFAQICGFCTTSKKGIPIKGDIAAYPYDPRVACSPTAIITTGNKCPRPTPQVNTAAAVAAAGGQTSDTPAFTTAASKALNACDPFANGRLPRQCLIKKAEQVGCMEDGSLITSLKNGSESNYFSELSKVPAYAEYQKRTDNSISEQSLKQGAATLDMLLSQFQAIKDNSASAANLGLKESAADLCMTAGTFEAFDFCIEFKDGDYTASIPLDCLQKEFLRGGGQKTGTLYPTTKNLSYWRKFTTWREFKGGIEDLGVKTLNTADRVTQQDAIHKLQGLPVDKLRASLGDIPGVEVFWFTLEAGIRNPNTYYGTFLGRRIRSNIPNLTGTSTAQGRTNAQAGFVYFTNIKPPATKQYNIKFNGDSGFIFLRNKPMEYNYSQGTIPKTNEDFSSLYDSFGSIAEMKTSQDGGGGPWTFDPSRPNVILGYYFGRGTNYSLKFLERSDVPDYCGCHGSVGFNGTMRSYTNAECNLLGGNFHGNGECTIRTGGSYTWNCKGLNQQNPCTNEWLPVSPNLLFLTQEAFAPMISFIVNKNYNRYNATYPFFDKRFGSHKMIWGPYVGNGPTWKYPGTVNDDNEFPLGMSYAALRGGAGLWGYFSFVRYSFMTLGLIIRFTKLPINGLTHPPLIFWPSNWNIGNPHLLLTGKGGGTASLNVMPRSDGAGTTDGPTVKEGVTYFITLRMLRSNDSDIYSLNGLQVGAAPLLELQDSVQSFMESSPLMFSDPRQLENPDAGYVTNFFIPPSTICEFDLFALQLYDYKLAGSNLKRAANNDWALLDGNIFA